MALYFTVLLIMLWYYVSSIIQITHAQLLNKRVFQPFFRDELQHQRRKETQARVPLIHSLLMNIQL